MKWRHLIRRRRDAALPGRMLTPSRTLPLPFFRLLVIPDEGVRVTFHRTNGVIEDFGLLHTDTFAEGDMWTIRLDCIHGQGLEPSNGRHSGVEHP